MLSISRQFEELFRSPKSSSAAFLDRYSVEYLTVIELSFYPNFLLLRNDRFTALGFVSPLFPLIGHIFFLRFHFGVLLQCASVLTGAVHVLVRAYCRYTSRPSLLRLGPFSFRGIRLKTDVGQFRK